METLLVMVVLLTLMNLSPSVSEGPRLACYFNSRAKFRAGKGQFTVDNIDPNYCTHIIYVSITFQDILSNHPSGSGAKISEINLDHPVVNFVKTLKEKNPKLKLMVSIGNWVDEDATTYVQAVMKNDGQRLNSFAASVIEYLTRFELDGLDFSWPWSDDLLIGANNPNFFERLLKVLNREFQPKKFLLSVGVLANQSVAAKSYNIPKINEYVDFVNLNAYNMTGSWERLTDHHAPLKGRSWQPENIKNVDSIVSYWLQRGLSASKLNMGIPFFGNSWTLSSSAVRPLSMTSGPGAAGPFTKKPGELAFYEICENVRIFKTFKAVRSTDKLHGPMAVSHKSLGGTWTAYDDAVMVKVKSEYILTRKLGGAVVWDISMDDFRNTCNTGNNPLLETISATLGIRTARGYPQRYVSNSYPITSFKWTIWLSCFLAGCLTSKYM